MKRRLRRLGRWLCAGLVSAAALAGAGCGLGPVPLAAHDSRMTLASARATYRLAGPEAGGAGIEFDYARQAARGDQAINAATIITLSGQSVSGPTTLRHDVRAEHATLSYNHRLFPGRVVQMEWMLGVGTLSMDWRSTPASAGQNVLVRRQSATGVAGGVAVRLQPRFTGDFAWLEARLAGVRRSDFYRAGPEAALVLAPLPNLRLRLGVSQLETWLGERDSAESPLELRSRGPFAALALAF